MPSALQNVGELEYSKLERDTRPDIVSSGPTRAVLQPLPILHLATNRDALLACNNAGGNAHRAPNNSTAVLVGSFSPQRTLPSKLNYLMRRSAPTNKKKASSLLASPRIPIFTHLVYTYEIGRLAGVCSCRIQW